MVGKEIVTVNSISKKYGKLYAVKNLSFSIRENTIFGLLGSNGAGKSTTLHMLMGLLSIEEGDLFIFGEKVKKKYSNSLKKKVAIVPQEISLYKDLTIYDNLYFFGRAYGFSRILVREKIKESQELFGLGDLKRPVKHLSGGYQRRVSFAVALIGNPDLIILDEALVGIDIETKKLIVDLLLKLKKSKTIIITTHSIDDAEKLCDEVLLLHQGEKKLCGKTKDLIRAYSSSEKRSLNIIFSNELGMKKFVEDLKPHISHEIIVNDLVVSVKFKEKISFNSKPNDFFNILGLANSYRNDIIDIEIKKSGLEELMMDAIRK
ncbi:MAG: ABC transporter ATP-binding protein [archaeon]